MHSYTTKSGEVRKLGRVKPKARPQTLHLASYVDTDTVTPPASIDYSVKAMAAISKMYLNDTYGDCVLAGVGHSLGVWSGNESGTPILATDQEISNAYFHLTGGRDSGLVISTTLDYWASNGFTLGGQLHKIDGYASLNWTNKVLAQVGLVAFGVVKLGLDLPEEWAESANGSTWDVTSSRIVGGHDVEAIGYDAIGVTIATWGSTRKITWAAFLSTSYIDEAYVMLAPEWYSVNNVAASGIDLADLKNDLQMVSSNTIPPLNPSPTPTPSPTPVVPPAPAPVGPTYAVAKDAVLKSIAAGTYGKLNLGNAVVNAVENAAINGLKTAFQISGGR